MKCPVCRQDSLREHKLEMDLPTYRCQRCEGVLILAPEYWEWLKEREEHPSPSFHDAEMPIPVEEAAQVKLCPECGHILRRYQIWPNIKFYLDRCGSCESVWFDRNEWEYLKSQGQHDKVRQFFGEMWQQELLDAEARERMERMYLERFGAEDYARIKEIRAWLWQHPQQGPLTAYLTDKDPHKPVSR